MLHISLFSGIGGFELAAQWMGWTNIVSCEINEFGNKVLEYYWPNAYHHKDVHTLTYDTINTELTRRFGAGWRNEPIVLTGGFPCQPFSAAGIRKGKDDDRYLWDEMLRAIREIQPTWVVGENVAGILSMVQPGSEVAVDSQASLFSEGNKETILTQEYVLETICRDLEREGYSVQPIVIPACSQNAPHRRDRIWICARRRDSGITPDPNGKGCERNEQYGSHEKEEWEYRESYTTTAKLHQISNGNGIDTDTYIKGLQGRKNKGTVKRKRKESNEQSARFICPDWENFPTQPPIRGRDDGVSGGLVGITLSKHRNESIKAYGNAIVPQVVYQIFKAIEQYEKL